MSKKININGVIVPNNDAWIYDYFEEEHTCPKNIADAIAEANGEPIDICINSGGGDIFAGSEIYSAIREYAGQVNIHITGLAASAASVIACAGHCDISPTAMLMVHNVSCSAGGDYHDMDKQSEILQKANETIANAYVTKSGMTMEEALAIMDKETWLSASDAVELKLVDEITPSKNIQLAASIGNGGLLPQSVIDKMQDMKLQDKLAEKTKLQARLDNLRNGGKNVD